MQSRLSVCVLVLFFSFSINSILLFPDILLFAEETQDKDEPSGIQTEAVSPAEKKEMPRKGDINFNFDDEDVFTVIQTIFGDILRVNYIIDPGVKGRVNLRTVAPVTKEEVIPLLEIILRLNGIGIVEDQGLYRIVPLKDVSKEPADVGIGRDAGKVRLTGKALIQVVPVYHIKSSELVRVLTPFVSTNASVVDVPNSNHLIIIDTDANIKRLLKLVEIFDSEQVKKVKPRVYVYNVQNGKAEDIALLLQQIFSGVKPSAQPAIKSAAKETSQPPQAEEPAAIKISGETLLSGSARIFPDKVTNTIIIFSAPEDLESITEIIKKIDIVPRQVLIEGLIARVDLTDSLKFGFAWSLKTDLSLSTKPFTRDFKSEGELGQRPSDLVDSSGKPVTLSGTGFTFLATDSKGIVRARLEALSSAGKVHVMAAPHILVSDNREARIQVGQQVPIQTVQTSNTVTTTSVQYKDIGIILKVKPQVNEGGLVSLEIAQEVSSSATSIEDIAKGSSPVINKTEASTYLVANNGETIIIGGLMREDTNKTRTGIPFLKDLPLIGILFGSTTKSIDKIELVILLTPYVIKNSEVAASITNDRVNKFIDISGDKKTEEFIDRLREYRLIDPPPQTEETK